MKNLNLITDLGDAILNSNDLKVAGIKFYREVAKLTLIEQYYWFKGFKMANAKAFYEVTAAAKEVDFGEVCDIIINILDNIHNIENSEDDYQAAYDGMGNIQAYIAEIEKIIPKV